MVRKLRYRQAIRKGKYVGGNLEGVPYKKAVRMYKALVKPETGTPTIPQARVMHTTLGTWDEYTFWSGLHLKHGSRNSLYVQTTGVIFGDNPVPCHKVIRPKADYKRIKGLTQ
ncbi:hypothetical protein [Bacillus wiedmannii]|uniref:hypothetical protein n=1 Tax=Bacillus wiedmannii TaxID=1890302 RepID=UPI000CD90A6E|nr:hypothetical protein [Bacillus wiedmannii]MBG9832143.1 hypothetical protein [Bacillus wiedmannii]UOB95742.1 hypothetical protein BTI679_30850 [Bacillus wiedmannii]